MMASCVVTLSKSRLESAARSRAPSRALKGDLAALLLMSIGNKLCSRSARLAASISAAEICPLWISPNFDLAVYTNCISNYLLRLFEIRYAHHFFEARLFLFR